MTRTSEAGLWALVNHDELLGLQHAAAAGRCCHAARPPAASAADRLPPKLVHGACAACGAAAPRYYALQRPGVAPACAPPTGASASLAPPAPAPTRAAFLMTSGRAKACPPHHAWRLPLRSLAAGALASKGACWILVLPSLPTSPAQNLGSRVRTLFPKIRSDLTASGPHPKGPRGARRMSHGWLTSTADLGSSLHRRAVGWRFG